MKKWRGRVEIVASQPCNSTANKWPRWKTLILFFIVQLKCFEHKTFLVIHIKDTQNILQ